MKRLGWYALRVTVAAFVLGGGLLLAANLYVQSHSVQQRIRTELAANLKMPVSLRKTTVTPWDGVRLDGIILHASGADGTTEADPESGPEFLSADSFRVQFAWWPLLAHRQFVVKAILLDKPLLTLRDGFNPLSEQEPETADQNENHPLPPPATGPTPPTPGASPQVATETPLPAPPNAQAAPEETRRPALVKTSRFLSISCDCVTAKSPILTASGIPWRKSKISTSTARRPTHSMRRGRCGSPGPAANTVAQC